MLLARGQNSVAREDLADGRTRQRGAGAVLLRGNQQIANLDPVSITTRCFIQGPGEDSRRKLRIRIPRLVIGEFGFASRNLREQTHSLGAPFGPVFAAWHSDERTE